MLFRWHPSPLVSYWFESLLYLINDQMMDPLNLDGTLTVLSSKYKLNPLISLSLPQPHPYSSHHNLIWDSVHWLYWSPTIYSYLQSPVYSPSCSQSYKGVREGGVGRLGGWAGWRDAKTCCVGDVLEEVTRGLPCPENSHASFFLSACLAKGF